MKTKIVSLLALTLLCSVSIGQTSEKLAGTIFGIQGNKEGALIETLYDGDLKTAPDMLGELKDIAWAVIDFGETSKKTITGVKVALRVPTNPDNVHIMQSRLTGLRFYGANQIDTLNNMISQVDTAENFLFEVSADLANSLVLEQLSDEQAVAEFTPEKGFRYVVIFFPAGSFGNCGEVELYGKDYSGQTAIVHNRESAKLAIKAYSGQNGLVVNANCVENLEAEVEVYNVLGALVCKQTKACTPGNNLFQFDNTEMLRNQVYILKLNAGGQSISQKVLY